MFKYSMFPFLYYCFSLFFFQGVKYSCNSMYLYRLVYRCIYYNSPLTMQESTANGLNFTTLRCMYYISTYYSVYHMCVIFCAVLNKIHSFIHSIISNTISPLFMTSPD